MNQSGCEKPQFTGSEKPCGTEVQPSASADAERVPGVQRELRFEDGDEPRAEQSGPHDDGPEFSAQSHAEPITQEFPGADPGAGETFVLALEKNPIDGSAGHVRHFAVALDGLVRPRDAEEQQQARRAATAWHHDLLGLLSRWTSGTKFRLRYQSGRGETTPPLHVSLIVTVVAQSAETAGARAHRIACELRSFLQNQEPRAGRVYDLRPVASEERLRRFLVPFRGGKGICLSRRTIPLANPDEPRIGFGAEPRHTAGPELPAAPRRSGTERHLSHLVRAMIGQRAPSLLDVSLRPTTLRPGELRRLRSLARGEATDGTALSAGEEEALIAFSEGLIQQASRCFEVEITLAQSRPPLSPAVQAAAERVFFRGVGSAETRKTTLEANGGLLQRASSAAPESQNSTRRNGRPGAGNETPEDGPPSTSPSSSRLRKLHPTEEAARLFRLPAPTQQDLPGLRPVHPASRHVPPGLPDEGALLGEKTVPSGRETTRKRVRLHPEDMFHHVYILGQTGTGKTTMLGSMMMERLEAGAGAGLIDPHGDLYDQILRAVPKRRRDDVILFDPADDDSDTKLNLLEYDPDRPRQRSTLINELLQIFDQEYDLERTGGPIFERYMRNALLLVMDDPEEPGTLLDVVRLFQEKGFREALLAECNNERVLRFWDEAESTPTTGELPSPENMSIYVTSKLSRFLDDDYLRALVDQRRSTLDVCTIIDEGKILLVKMQKGKLGKLGVRMFGTIIVARLMMAALAREEIPEDERRDFFLFVDEFQSFTTPTIANLLSEARKFRLSLTLANQTLYQLDDDIVNAVLGNVGSLITLRPGVKDYERIEPFVSPPFRREDVVNLPNYTAIARLLARGEPTRPFVFNAIPLLEEGPSRESAVKGFHAE